jgi:hypothetical protein
LEPEAGEREREFCFHAEDADGEEGKRNGVVLSIEEDPKPVSNENAR